MKPPTIEERAKALGLVVRITPHGDFYLTHNDVCLDTFPSRRAVAKWLDGAEAMHKIMSEQIDTLT